MDQEENNRKEILHFRGAEKREPRHPGTDNGAQLSRTGSAGLLWL